MSQTAPPPPPAAWGEPTPPPSSPEPGVPPTRKGRSKGKWIAGGVVALLVIGAIGSLGKSSDSAAVPTPSPTTAAAVVPSTPESPEEPSLEATTEPSDEPVVEATTEPSDEPAVEETPEPTPAVVKAASGRGDKVVKFAAQDGPTIARITNKGSSNFAVTSYIGSEYDNLLVNEIGSFAGTVYVNPGVSRLKVESNGSWKITIRPIDAAKSWDGTSAIAGKGDSVIQLSGAGSYTTTIKNKSRSNFAVTAYSIYGEYLDLLVNEIGSYTGEVLLPDADPMVLVVEDVGGTWSMTATQP